MTLVCGKAGYNLCLILLHSLCMFVSFLYLGRQYFCLFLADLKVDIPDTCASLMLVLKVCTTLPVYTLKLLTSHAKASTVYNFFLDYFRPGSNF